MSQCRAAAAALLLVIGSGCQAPQHSSNAQVTPLRDYRCTFPETVEAPSQPSAPSPTPAPPQTASTEPSLPAINSTNHWVSLEAWAAHHGLGHPHQVPSAIAPTYRVQGVRGKMELMAGTRTFRWNGLEHWLGFAPKANHGQLELHVLDLEKNLAPLMIGAQGWLATNRVIVIDPGHGGEDTGAQSAVSERCEKVYALDWARRLQALLVTNGWTVFLTRTNDSEQSLSNRISFTQQKKADLFISLHFNAAPLNRLRSGLETYCLTPSGLTSTLTRDFPDDPALVFPNNAFDTQNLELASCLHRAVVAATGRVDGGVRRARFMAVLRGQVRPAALLEGGYLTNPQEAELIAKPDYRQRLAEAVAHALFYQAMSGGRMRVVNSPEGRASRAAGGY